MNKLRPVVAILALALALPMTACNAEEEPLEDDVREAEEVQPGLGEEGLTEDEGLVEEDGAAEDEGL